MSRLSSDAARLLPLARDELNWVIGVQWAGVARVRGRERNGSGRDRSRPERNAQRCRLGLSRVATNTELAGIRLKIDPTLRPRLVIPDDGQVEPVPVPDVVPAALYLMNDLPHGTSVFPSMEEASRLPGMETYPTLVVPSEDAVDAARKERTRVVAARREAVQLQRRLSDEGFDHWSQQHRRRLLCRDGLLEEIEALHPLDMRWVVLLELFDTNFNGTSTEAGPWHSLDLVAIVARHDDVYRSALTLAPADQPIGGRAPPDERVEPPDLPRKFVATCRVVRGRDVPPAHARLCRAWVLSS